MEYFKSAISGDDFPISERVIGSTIRPSIFSLIKDEYPNFEGTQCVSKSELKNFRKKYIMHSLEKELGTLTDADQHVIHSISDNHLISADKSDDLKVEKIGDRIADQVADFGGSWTFICSFIVFLLIWIFANMFWLHNKGFDPYPFILLNLILSCVAALQAPVIMMSQNRQEDKDRDRAKNDYMVNLKAELEIRALHEKLDHLIAWSEQEGLHVKKEQNQKIETLLAKIIKLEEHIAKS